MSSKFAEALAALVDAHIEDMLVAGAGAPVSESVEADVQKGRATKAKAKSKAAAEEVVEEDEDEEDPWDARLAELMKKTLAALKKIAKALEFDDEDLEGADKDTLAASIVAAEKEDAEEGSDDDEEVDEESDEEEAEEEDDDSEEEEDEDSEDDEEDEDEEGYTREELEALGIRELKALAKESGWSAEDLKPYTAKNIGDLVDALAGDEDSEDDEEDDEEEEEGYSEEDLDEMSLAELKKVAKDEYGIKLKVGMKKPAVIAAILKKAAA